MTEKEISALKTGDSLILVHGVAAPLGLWQVGKDGSLHRVVSRQDDLIVIESASRASHSKEFHVDDLFESAFTFHINGSYMRKWFKKA